MTNEKLVEELTVWQAIEVLTKAMSYKTKLEEKVHDQINKLGKHICAIETEISDIRSSLKLELGGASHAFIDTDTTNLIFITAADIHSI